MLRGKNVGFCCSRRSKQQKLQREKTSQFSSSSWLALRFGRYVPQLCPPLGPNCPLGRGGRSGRGVFTIGGRGEGGGGGLWEVDSALSSHFLITSLSLSPSHPRLHSPRLQLLNSTLYIAHHTLYSLLFTFRTNDKFKRFECICIYIQMCVFVFAMIVLHCSWKILPSSNVCRPALPQPRWPLVPRCETFCFSFSSLTSSLLRLSVSFHVNFQLCHVWWERGQSGILGEANICDFVQTCILAARASKWQTHNTRPRKSDKYKTQQNSQQKESNMTPHNSHK